MLIYKIILLFLFVTLSDGLQLKDPVKFFRYGLEDDVKGKLELKIIVHGLNASNDAYWYQPMIDAYRKKNISVLAVDWKDMADDSYADAIVAASNVAEELTNEIFRIKKVYNIDYSNIHIIGHSLGAHIAGYTGKSIFNSTGIKIGRITGLDPAGPGFQSLVLNERLSKEDAQFVDVIHTDTDFLGINLSIGHADFYPNGGALQNGCNVIDFGCSHKVVTDYFIESISSDSFVARRCDSYLKYIWRFCKRNNKAIMGDGCDTNAYGDYYLTTNAKSPYGKGL